MLCIEVSFSSATHICSVSWQLLHCNYGFICWWYCSELAVCGYVHELLIVQCYDNIQCYHSFNVSCAWSPIILKSGSTSWSPWHLVLSFPIKTSFWRGVTIPICATNFFSAFVGKFLYFYRLLVGRAQPNSREKSLNYAAVFVKKVKLRGNYAAGQNSLFSRQYRRFVGHRRSPAV